MGTSHKDIETKKAALELKLRGLEGKLDRSFDEVRSGVSESLSIKKIISRYPLPAVGVAVLAGMLLGKPRGSRKNRTGFQGGSSSDDVFSVMGRTLKKRLTQKAIDTVMDLVEKQFAESGRGSDPK